MSIWAAKSNVSLPPVEKKLLISLFLIFSLFVITHSARVVFAMCSRLGTMKRYALTSPLLLYYARVLPPVDFSPFLFFLHMDFCNKIRETDCSFLKYFKTGNLHNLI